MAVRTVVIWPDPILKTVTKPVGDVDATIRALTVDMFDTMYAYEGIGLAANQIGVSLRVMVLDLDGHLKSKNDPRMQQELASWGFDKPLVLINPRVLKAEGEIVWNEGCLSVPGEMGAVKRKATLQVQALNREGEPFILNASGLLAVAIQHELDHLNGKVFVDYLSKLKRDVIRRKMQRAKIDAVKAHDQGAVAAS